MHGFRGKLFPQKDLWGALSVPPIQQRPQPLGYFPLLVAKHYMHHLQGWQERKCTILYQVPQS